jgi:anti-sigma factor RsiW
MSSAGNSSVHCGSVQEQLSAFHDGELSPDVRAAVARHIEGCSECSRRLAELRELSRITAELPTPEIPPEVWQRIEQKLVAKGAWQGLPLVSLIRRRRAWVSLATAAIAIVAVSTATVVWFGQAEQGRQQVAVNFGRYLDEFERNPAAAQQLLLSKYEGRAVDLDEAARQVRHRPAVRETLPDGASLEALYLLKMPCCLCVQAVYRRDNGERLAIFEHVDDEPIWFGTRPAIHARCNGTPTSIVQVDGYLAASWRRDGRFLTVVGPKDVEQLLRLMASLDDKRG